MKWVEMKVQLVNQKHLLPLSLVNRVLWLKIKLKIMYNLVIKNLRNLVKLRIVISLVL